MPRPRHALLALCFAASAGLARADEPAKGRKYLLERVDEVAVVQLYADGFSKLPLDQKKLIYHLYEAALAGRDIYYDQRCADGLAMRALVEAVLRKPEGVDPETLAAVTKYAKLFWINSGPYNHLTARKNVLAAEPGKFETAVASAVKAGVVLPKAVKASDVTGRLKAMFFDPAYRPIVTNKTPGPGGDILADSANNLYVGVTTRDLDGFQEKYGLNSRVVKTKDGKLEEQVYKVGGMYDSPIRKIVAHLEEARALAPEPMAKALKALIKFYKTGEEADRKAYDIAWVKDKASPVDVINGFIEVYLDTRGVKGSWESVVYFVNQEKTGGIKKLAAEAQWFEDHMPWAKAFRKADVKGITANAIDVVIETGDTGPVTPIGINLPNDQQIRESDGSKSVSLSNVIEAGDKATPSSLRKEFSWTDAEAERTAKWGTLASELLVNMHEVIGHASGRQAEGFKGSPQDTIKQYFSALEEGRADLVALYFMADPKLAALGLVPAEGQAEMAHTAYEQYTRNVLAQLRRVRQGDQIEEDHMRNRQMVVHWLIKNTKAIEVRQKDGKTYYVMTDPEAFHEGVGKLLAEVQRIKSEGDFAGAKNLFETYGIRFDPKLRDEVVKRVESLDLPSYTAFVMPELKPVRKTDGGIEDVSISYPLDLAKQMLGFSASK